MSAKLLSELFAGRMRTAHIPSLIAIACIACASSFARSAETSNLQVVHESWTFKEGAPQDVESLAQTADGYLWLGGPNGLIRFDGTRFEPFRSPLGDQLLSTNISALLAPRSGGLWLGYRYGGFSFHKNGRVTN
jgi:ligand-binding sensor domain-containing protein